jgi:iron complex transport system ATP-binding protein
VDILDLIKGLSRRDGLTVIIALHELNLAAQYCDRLVLINGGKIQYQGSPADVITEENIKRVYGNGSYVGTHPLSGLPVVLPTAGTGKSQQ